MRVQAVPVDRIQIEKVRLAIRWRVHPDDISDRRAMRSIAEHPQPLVLLRGEQLVGYFGREGEWVVIRG